MSTTWQPFYSGHKVATLAELEGLLIPDPDALQGWIAYVVNVPAPIGGPAYYSLSLTSGAPLSPTDVRPTVLGGTSRWLRLMFESSAFGGPPTTIEPDDPPNDGISPLGARADHQHGIAADIAGVIEPDDAPAEGVSTAFARADHQHGIGADVPVPIGPVLAEGVSSSFARADHVHTLGALPLLLKWSGSVTLDYDGDLIFADNPVLGPYPAYPIPLGGSISELTINAQASAPFAFLPGEDLTFQLLLDGVAIGTAIVYNVALAAGNNVQTVSFPSVAVPANGRLSLRVTGTINQLGFPGAFVSAGSQ